jgi:hypothetical protein
MKRLSKCLGHELKVAVAVLERNSLRVHVSLLLVPFRVHVCV